MTTYYVDLENGNDANDGLSFANRKKNVSSVTAATGGDVIRVMSSPDPQNTGYTGVWRSGLYSNFKTISISALNTATPRVATATAHGLVTGDFILIAFNTTSSSSGIWQITKINNNSFSLDGSSGGTSTSGVAYYFTNNVIEMPSGGTHFKSIASSEQLSRTAWTASTNVSTTLTNGGMNGTPYDGINITATFTTGKAAYKTVPNIDITGYTRLSFWANQQSGTSPGNNYALRLCSDTQGNTMVAEALFTTPTNSTWTHFEVDLSAYAPFSGNINSVALYLTSDKGAQLLYLSNIIVSKPRSSDDSISHGTLISKSGSANTNAEWYAIQGITQAGHLVISTGANPTIPATSGMYYGTTESATIYKREPILIGNPGTTVMTCNNSGTWIDNKLTISGGWNRTDMSTQTGETWVQRYNGQSGSIGLTLAGSYVKVEKIAGARLASLINQSSGAQQGLEIYVPGCSSVTSVFNCPAPTTITNGSYFELNYGTSSGITFTTSSSDAINFKELKVDSFITGSLVAADKTTIGRIACAAQAISCGTINSTIEITDGIYGCSRAIYPTSTYPTKILRLGTVENTSQSIVGGTTSIVGDVTICNGSIVNVPYISGSIGRVFLKNVTTSGVTALTQFPTGYQGARTPVSLSTDNGTYTYYGKWEKESTIVHTEGSSAWEISPTNTQITQANPLIMPLGQVAVVGGSTVTISVWARRTNTALTLKLVVPGGQVAGMSSSAIEDSMTASADTWEELSVSFTPTQAGVIELEIHAYGGSTYSGFIDDLTVSQ